jgi:Holliday junction resolvasome RuvABC endonuclease subunit
LIIAGVDYSITSPSICIHNGETWSIDNCTLYYLSQKQKQIVKTPRIKGILYPEWETPEQRFHQLAKWTLGVLIEHRVQLVVIEGYSYGSKSSSLFQIAENGGTLKQMIWQAKIPFSVAAPTTIKKFATGKGNSNKAKMWDSFIEETNLDLFALLGQIEGKNWNPVSDMVDAYYLAKFAFEQQL